MPASDLRHAGIGFEVGLFAVPQLLWRSPGQWAVVVDRGGHHACWTWFLFDFFDTLDQHRTGDAVKRMPSAGHRHLGISTSGHLVDLLVAAARRRR